MGRKVGTACPCYGRRAPAGLLRHGMHRAIGGQTRYHPLAMALPGENELAPPKSFQQWLAQGEMLYAAMIREYQALESQVSELESRMAAKQAEVNQLAQIIRKPAIEGRRLSAQLVTSYAPDMPPVAPQIARALSGGRPAVASRPPAAPRSADAFNP